MLSYIHDLLDYVSLVFQLVGVGALVIGTFYAAYSFFKHWGTYSVDDFRLGIGKSMVLALEFFVAGDIINTVIAPDYYEIGILAILVIIRTFINYYLNKEIYALNTHQETV